MASYSLRCRNYKCRHRRISKIHPDDAKLVYRCPSCKKKKGWRIENRAYNKKDLCTCGKVPLYPHRKGKHKYCTYHPEGIYNQAKRQGVPDEDIPYEHMPHRNMEEDEPCPF